MMVFEFGGVNTARENRLHTPLSLETFSEKNRSKVIGDSFFIICRSEQSGNWYIHERISNSERYAAANGFHNSDLGEVIRIFNSINASNVILEE